MLNELLKDEDFGRIFFAELLNQNGCDTGVDTASMFEEWARKNDTNNVLEGVELERFKQNLVKKMHSSPNEDLVVLGDVIDKEDEEDDTMEDIPMNIRQLEEKTRLKKPEVTEGLAEPDYYAGNGLSPLEAFKKGLLSIEEYVGFCKGNVIKYTVRAGKKENASEDIVKAIDYLGHLKRFYESDAYYIDKSAAKIVKEALEGLNKIEEVEPKL